MKIKKILNHEGLRLTLENSKPKTENAYILIKVIGKFALIIGEVDPQKPDGTWIKADLREDKIITGNHCSDFALSL